MANRDVIHETYARVGKAADELGIDSLTPPQQTLLYSWMALGVLENGGFGYFYEVSGQALKVAAAYRALGLGKWAEAFELSRTVFPDSNPENMGASSRDDWFSENEDVAGPLLEPYVQYIYKNPRELERALLKLIELNPTDFAP